MTTYQAEWLQRARELEPLVRELRDEGERDRELPKPVWRAMREAGLFSMWVPRSLGGAEVLVYPTAIGSEPDHPDFDTMPLWRQVIVANGITAGTFMVVPNRIGTEQLGDTAITFYGSSFVSDPYGRILAEAPRGRPAVLVADLDLDQKRDWLDLFPFDTTRRPDTYRSLVEPPA